MEHLQYRVCHILVNFRNTKQTAEFLRSILTSQVDLEVVDLAVVDNSHMETGTAWQNEFKSLVKFLLPEKNLGYFGGAQWALENLNHEAYQFVIVSNTDLKFADKDFYRKLLLTGFKPEVGVLAPSIISEFNHSDSNPYLKQRPSAARMNFYQWIFATYLGSMLYQVLGYIKAKLLTPAPPASGGLIYAGHGAFLIFGRSYFKKGGNFRHFSFLYNEEILVAEFCRSQNLQTQYVPELKVHHFEHGSTGLQSYFLSKNTFIFKRDSARICFSKYFA